MKVDPFIPVTKTRQVPAARRTPQKTRPTLRAQSVDGFIRTPTPHRKPASKSSSIRKGQPQAPQQPAKRTTPASSPFIRPREAIPHSFADQAFRQTEMPSQQNQPLPSRALNASIPPAKPTKSRFKKLFGLTLQIIILLIIFALGFLLRSIVVGQVLIIVYAVVAFLLRIESRTTFILALMSLGVVLIASLKSDSGLASLFAVYAFLLLAVGTLCLGREVRDEI